MAVAEAAGFDASFLEIWTSSRYTTGLGSMLWVLSGRAGAWRATGYLRLVWLRNQAKLAFNAQKHLSRPTFKLPRSHSSPSPPSSRQGRGDPSRKHNGTRPRRRLNSAIVDPPRLPSSAAFDWSTSYQAGSSRHAHPIRI